MGDVKELPPAFLAFCGRCGFHFVATMEQSYPCREPRPTDGTCAAEQVFANRPLCIKCHRKIWTAGDASNKVKDIYYCKECNPK